MAADSEVYDSKWKVGWKEGEGGPRRGENEHLVQNLFDSSRCLRHEMRAATC